jgi:hypothetical protein
MAKKKNLIWDKHKPQQTLPQQLDQEIFYNLWVP